MAVTQLSSLGDLPELIDNGGGLATFEMWELREAHGAGRLGVHVRANISRALRGTGLAHYPDPLPDRQSALVRIYRQGSRAAALIDAVLDPTQESDEAIREAIGGEAQTVLEQVRELVCE
jgi:hypothetical protein